MDFLELSHVHMLGVDMDILRGGKCWPLKLEATSWTAKFALTSRMEDHNI
jgi:hypothetical protein